MRPIVEYRKKHGPFKSAEDLSLVKGIGERTVELVVDDPWVRGECVVGNDDDINIRAFYLSGRRLRPDSRLREGHPPVSTPNSVFETFLRDIEPSATTKTNASSAHTGVRDHLRKHDDFKDKHVTTFLSGSYKRDTAIRDNHPALMYRFGGIQ